MARAQDEGAPPEAVELYQRGSEHYRAGRYREAIKDLKAALALDPNSPNLVYNVARVSELLGNLSEAIEYYERYIALLPASQRKERQDAEATIRRLEGARDELSAQADTSSALREPIIVEVEAPPMGKADLYFWATAGLGVAALAGSAVTGLLALRREQEVRDFVAGPDGSAGERQSIMDEADTLALTTDLLLVGGTLSVASAASLFFFRDPGPAETRGPHAKLSVSPTGAVLTGQF